MEVGCHLSVIVTISMLHGQATRELLSAEMYSGNSIGYYDFIKNKLRNLSGYTTYFYLREGIRRAEMQAFPFAAARKRVKLAKRVSSRFLIIFFNFHNHIYTFFMSSPKKFCFEPCVNNHFGHFDSNDPRTKSKNIGIIMLS